MVIVERLSNANSNALANILQLPKPDFGTFYKKSFREKVICFILTFARRW